MGQVGTYFVGQYYQVLQNQPDFVHQFYSEASTMIRIDGNNRDTASAMLVYFSLSLSLSLSLSIYSSINNVGFGFCIHEVGFNQNMI